MRAYSRLTSHQSKKFVAHKKTIVFAIWVLFVLNIFLLIFCVSKITYLDFITIKNISVYGTRDNITTDIQNNISSVLGSSYFGIFSKANSFLYPKSTLLASVQNIAPQIESITINRNSLQVLEINVIEKIPTAKICATLPDLSINNTTIDQVSDCYFADRLGLIFDTANALASSSINLYFIPSLSELSATSQSILEKYATSTNEFVLLQNFYDGTKKAGLSPKFILVKDNGEYEMYANDTVIYFNDKRLIVEQLQNLITFWNHRKSVGNINYEYIDIRYGSNIFYREKSQ